MNRNKPWKLKAYYQKNKEKIMAYQREYRRTHKEQRTKEQHRDQNLKHNYGLSLKQYDEMFLKQKGLCLGCYKHRTNFKYSLAVDHDHKTGRIRGLLCIKCNSVVGYGNDNPLVLRRLADYLEGGI